MFSVLLGCPFSSPSAREQAFVETFVCLFHSLFILSASVDVYGLPAFLYPLCHI